MRAELEVSLPYDVILQMAAAGQSNQRRFTIFFIFKIVKFVSWMSWRWQTLTARTSASSAADGCYCCRMTWRQYNPNVQLQAFFFAAWSKFVFITCSNNKALALFFIYTSHLHPFPRWTMGHQQSGCALQTKGNQCVVMPPALRCADLQHFTPHPRHGWMV